MHNDTEGLPTWYSMSPPNSSCTSPWYLSLVSRAQTQKQFICSHLIIMQKCYSKSLVHCCWKHLYSHLWQLLLQQQFFGSMRHLVCILSFSVLRGIQIKSWFALNRKNPSGSLHMIQSMLTLWHGGVETFLHVHSLLTVLMTPFINIFATC